MLLTITGDLITTGRATRWPHTGNRAPGPGQTALQVITLATRSPQGSSGSEPAISPPGRQTRR